MTDTLTHHESPYCCDVGGCHKRFKRSDHLLRHKRNHDNSSSFICSWQGCGKRFVRKDVQMKHHKRHMEKAANGGGGSDDGGKMAAVRFFEIHTPELVDSGRAAKRVRVAGEAGAGTDTEIVEVIGEEVVMEAGEEAPEEVREAIKAVTGAMAEEPEETSTLQVEMKTPAAMMSDPASAMSGAMSEATNATAEAGAGAEPVFEKSSIDYVMNDLSPPLQDLEMSDLIAWLLNDNPDNPHKYLDYSPSSSFKDLLGGTPNFLVSTSQSSVTATTLQKMASLVPALDQCTTFTAEGVEQSLASYWNVYHLQFPIIHRPTFSTASASPLLLLSMVAIGASLGSRGCKDKAIKDEMVRMAETIAQPLRYLICSHSENLPTISAWILQSLLILECFEITCSHRRFHRRAHLHHGFKIELLRRSPLLGGDPMKASDSDGDGDGYGDGQSDADSSPSVWANWVEIESLKRCAYVTFLVDTCHAIIFGHDPILFTHHLKLGLPCHETAWETSGAPFNRFESLKFLSLITKLLRRQPVEASPLVGRMLLVGIIALVLHTEQNDQQTTALQAHGWRSWKTDLLGTLDFWYDNVVKKSNNVARRACCAVESAIYCPPDLPPYGITVAGDTSCQFPVYHIAQAFLRLSQYDCIIYAGAPTRMNVKTESKDYAAVSERVRQWAGSNSGAMLVAHAYSLLCEVLLTRDEYGRDTPISYDPNRDPVFYRPNIVASAVFVVWDYVFCLDGPEARYLELSEYVLSSSYIPEKLKGHRYLQKVQAAFQAAADNVSASQLDASVSADTAPAAALFQAYASAVATIPGKNQVVGLLRLLKDRYNGCNSQVCREYGRLMENCIQRSLGRRSVMCQNMYDL